MTHESENVTTERKDEVIAHLLQENRSLRSEIGRLRAVDPWAVVLDELYRQRAMVTTAIEAVKALVPNAGAEVSATHSSGESGPAVTQDWAAPAANLQEAC